MIVDKMELEAYETWKLEECLQNLQVFRQPLINMKFAQRPMQFGDGELAAFNRAIIKLEQIIILRNDFLKMARIKNEIKL